MTVDVNGVKLAWFRVLVAEIRSFHIALCSSTTDFLSGSIVIRHANAKKNFRRLSPVFRINGRLLFFRQTVILKYTVCLGFDIAG